MSNKSNKTFKRKEILKRSPSVVSTLGQQVERLQKNQDNADYLLGEVHSYVIIHKTEIEKEFYDWFMRNMSKYQVQLYQGDNK